MQQGGGERARDASEGPGVGDRGPHGTRRRHVRAWPRGNEGRARGTKERRVGEGELGE